MPPESANDTIPTHRGMTTDERRLVEELALIQSVSVDGLVANVCIAALVAVSLADSSGKAHTLAWFGYMMCAVAARYVLHRAYHRSRSALRQNPHWGRIITGSNLLLGLGWAWMGVLLFPLDAPWQPLTALAAVVAVAATVHTISPSRAALAAFMAPVVLPFTVRLAAIHNNEYWLPALLLFILFVMTWFTLNRFRGRLYDSVDAHYRRRESDAAMLRGSETANRLFAQVVIERERAEAELKVAKQAADDANRAKGDFLAYTSHELRTPLNAIIGFADVLLGSELRPTQNDYVRRVKNAGTRLLTLINDLLDLSKIEAGKLNIEYADFQLRQTLDEVLYEQSVRAKEKKIGLEMHIAPDVPDNLIGDSLRLRQILLNLIGNSIKFTAQGKIAAEVKLKQLINGVAHLEFAVTDTGIGIPSDKLPKMFERYSQAEASTARKYGGTGLGLSICKSLVELMGGTISVQSEVGKGSVFTFDLPCKVQPAAQAPEKPVTTVEADRFDGMTVLVAEDNEHNQLLIELLLKKKGVDVTLVDDGAQAIDKLAATDYDLVFMDLEMPVMGGFEAAAAIRQNEKSNGKRATIVALSAHPPEEQRDNCIAAGMDDFLMKPFNDQSLRAMLQKYYRAHVR